MFCYRIGDDTQIIGTGGGEGEVKICSQPILTPEISGVSSVCLLKLGVGIKQLVGREFRRGRSVRSTVMSTGRKKG